MKTWTWLVLAALPALAWAQAARPVPDQTGLAQLARSAAAEGLQWKPAEGLPAGAEFAFLHQDEGGKSAEVLIRLPRNYELPSHWHTGGETLVVVEGRLIVASQGKEGEYGPGSYVYHPGGLLHSTRTPRWKSCLFYARMDGPFDIFFSR